MKVLSRVFSRHRYVIVLIVSVYVLDQLTKYIVTHSLQLGESMPAEGFIRLTYIFNTGSAFGLFQGQNTALIVASFLGVAILAIVYRSNPKPNWVFRTSLGLQLAGATGNLTDRLIVGKVIDFFDVGPWPIFNIADSSIVIGVLLLGWAILTTKPKSQADDGRTTPNIEDYP